MARHDELDPARSDAIFDELAGAGATRLWPREGFAPDEHRLSRTARPALLRAGVRGPGAGGRTGEFGPGLADAVADAFHDAHRALYGYDFRGDRASRWSG